MSAEGYRIIQIGQATKLVYLADDLTTALFPQATVYLRENDTLFATVNLSHVTNGLYRGDFTPTSETEYDVVIIPYSDAGHTTRDNNYTVATIKIISKSITAGNVGNGMYSESGGILEEDIETIAKKVWQYQLRNGQLAEQELIKKSEFDFEQDIVKTDIPAPDFSGLEAFIDKRVAESEKTLDETIRTYFDKIGETMAEELMKMPHFEGKELVKKIEELRGIFQLGLVSNQKDLTRSLNDKFVDLIKRLPKESTSQILLGFDRLNKRFVDTIDEVKRGDTKIVNEIKQKNIPITDLTGLEESQRLIKFQLDEFNRFLQLLNQLEEARKSQMLRDITDMLNKVIIIIKQKQLNIDEFIK
jgi:hypothetical protein